jgi:tetratricopeptide (TPR) repeat protein
LTLGPEWLTALGRVEARAGRVREARQMLALAEKASGDTLTDSSVNRNLQQDDVQIMGLKGEIARADGKFTEAITLLQAVGNGRGHYAIYSLASALQGVGRLEGASREYQRLLDRRPLGDEAQEDWLAAHVRLGEIFERLNRPAAARQQYEKLLTLWKDGDQDLKLRAQATAGLARLSNRRS